MDQQIIEKHRNMIKTNNVVIAKNTAGELIVIQSKRTIKPSVPFIIYNQVFQEWKTRESSMVLTDLPYEKLFTKTNLFIFNRENDPLVIVDSFDDIEFTEE